MVMRALNSNIAGDVLTKVVQHLMSEDVGITSIGELPFVTADMLPPSLGLPRIKISQLLRHFLAPQTIDQPGTDDLGGRISHVFVGHIEEVSSFTLSLQGK